MANDVSVVEVEVQAPAAIVEVLIPGIPGATGSTGTGVPEDTLQAVNASGAVVLEYTSGRHVVVTLTADVTSLEIHGWPTALVGRLTLVVKAGAFVIGAWPTGSRFVQGVVPQLTPDGRDYFVLISDDGGSTVDVLPAGPAVAPSA